MSYASELIAKRLREKASGNLPGAQPVNTGTEPITRPTSYADVLARKTDPNYGWQTETRQPVQAADSFAAYMAQKTGQVGNQNARVDVFAQPGFTTGLTTPATLEASRATPTAAETLRNHASSDITFRNQQRDAQTAAHKANEDMISATGNHQAYKEAEERHNAALQDVKDAKNRVQANAGAEWMTEQQGKYTGLNRQADFAELSQPDEEKIKRFSTSLDFSAFGERTGSNKNLYYNINKTRLLNREHLKDGSLAPGDVGSYAFMTDDEAANYNYIYNKQGPDAARSFYEYLKYDLDLRKQDARLGKWEDIAAEKPVAASAFSVATNLGSVAGIVSLAAQNAQRAVTGSSAPINYNTGAFAPAKVTKTVRDTVTREIERKHPKATAGEVNVLSFLYQTGMSMADSAVIAVLGTVGLPAAELLLGGSAATQAALDAKERGASDREALFTGIAAGAAESIFEKVSLESLIKPGEVNGVKDVIHNVLKQSFTEGSEEFFTTLANMVTDAAINGDKSEINRSIAEYRAMVGADGTPIYTEAEAKKAAWNDWLTGLLTDFLGGALSGGILGGGASGVRFAAETNVRKTGKMLKSLQINNETVKALVQYDMEATQETADKDMQKFLGGIAQRLVDGEDLSGKLGDEELGRLYAIYQVEQAKQNTQSVPELLELVSIERKLGSGESISSAKLGALYQGNLRAEAEQDFGRMRERQTQESEAQETAAAEESIESPVPEAERAEEATAAPAEEAAPDAELTRLESAAKTIRDGGTISGQTVRKIMEDTDAMQALRDSGALTETVRPGAAGRQTVLAAVQRYAEGRQDLTLRLREAAPAAETQEDMRLQLRPVETAESSGKAETLALARSWAEKAPVAIEVKNTYDNQAVTDYLLRGGYLTKEDVTSRDSAAMWQAMTRYNEEAGSNGEAEAAGSRERQEDEDGAVRERTRYGGFAQRKNRVGADGSFVERTEQIRKGWQRREAAGSLRNYLRNYGNVEVSTREAGIPTGTEQKSLRIIPEYTDEQTEEQLRDFRQAQKEFEARGITVEGFTGTLILRDEDGRNYRARGYVSGDGSRILVRLDHPTLSWQEVLLHEDFHQRVKSDKALLRDTAQAFLREYGQEELNAIIADYAEAYGYVNEADYQYIAEEVLADYYAGIDVFAGSEDAQADIRERSETVKRAVGHRGEMRREGGDNAQALGKTSRETEQRFSMEMPVEETKDLLALHNLTEKNLLDSIKLGGLPMPSIAVVKAEAGHSKYEPISIVFGKSTIDPKADRRNKVYGSDAWTPTAPQIGYEANSETESRISDKFRDIEKKYGRTVAEPLYRFTDGLEDKLNQYGGEQGIIERLESDTDMMNAFLADSGKEPVSLITREVRKTIPEGKIAQYNAVIQALGEEAFQEFAKRPGETYVDARRRWQAQYGEALREAYRQFLLETIPEEAVNALMDDPAFSVAKLTTEIAIPARKYLREGAETVSTETDIEATIQAIREKTDKAEYRKWLEELFKGAEKRKGIYNGKDPYTENGNRRSFRQLHYPYELEYIVKAMKETQAARGQGSLGVGAGTLQAVASPEYRSISEVKSDKGRLGAVDEEAYSKALKQVDSGIYSVIDAVRNQNPARNGNSFIQSDNIASALKDAAKGSKTASAITKSFSEYGLKLDADTVRQIQQLYEAAAALPTEYFEAKPQRAVGFDEALAVVTPENSSEELLRELRAAGANVLTYEAGNEADRLAKINSVEGARFSRELDYNAEKLREPITEEDINTLRSIGKKSVFEFTEEDFKKAGKWIYKLEQQFSDRTKAPLYRALYGEWRDKDSTPVKAAEKAEPFKAGKETNLDTGIIISWGNQVKGETKAKYGTDSPQYRGLEYIADIVKNAVLLDSVVSAKTSKSKLPNTTMFHSFYALVKENDGLHVLKLVAEEAANKDYSNHFVRAYEIQSIEKVANPHIGVLSENGGLTERDATISTVADLYAAVKGERERESAKNNIETGIRFSRDLPGETAELREENRQLREKLAWWVKQMTLTEHPEVRREDSDKLARRVLKKYSSKTKLDSIGDDVKALGDYLLRKDVKWTDAKDRSLRIAQRILDNSQVLVEDGNRDFYRDLKSYFRGKRISFSSQSDIADYGNWRKRNLGRFIIAKDGTPIDSLWEELQETFGKGYFPDDITHQADMMLHVEELFDRFRETYENPYSADLAEAAEYVANDLLDGLIRGEVRQESPTIADRTEYVKKLLRQERARRNEIIAERVRSSNREYREAYQEKRKQEELREKITDHTVRLAQKVLKPNDKSHVPEDLRRGVAAIIAAIDLDNGYNLVYQNGEYRATRKKDFIEQDWEPTQRNARFAFFRKEVAKIADLPATHDGELSFGESMQNLKKVLKQMEREGATVDEDLFGDEESDIPGLIDTVIHGYNMMPISRMDSAMLEDIWHVLRAIEGAVNNVNRVLSSKRNATVSDIAERLRRENEGKTAPKEFTKFLGKVQSTLGLQNEEPLTYFHKLGKTGEEIFRILRDAKDEETIMERKAAEATDAILKEFKDVDLAKLEKDVKRVKVSGKEFYMSKAQILDLYLLMRRQQGAQHVIEGGFIPEAVEVKGRKINTAKPIRIKEYGDIAHLFGNEYVSDRELAFARALQKYVGEELPEFGNKTSMNVFGYRKFGQERNYWRIRSNKTEIASQPGKERQVTTVKNRGFTKSTRPDATTSVMIGSVFDSYTRSVSDMITYAAWLAASEDLNHIKNYNFFEADKDADGKESFKRADTVGGILNTVHGSGGMKYLDDLLVDIASGTKVFADSALTTQITSGYKAAAIGANLRVIVQQPTAILRTMSMIDPKYLAEGVGKPFKGFEEAKKYAPIAQWKDWGYFDITTGKTLKTILFGEFDKLEAAKAKLMEPAGKADSFAWGILWNAVKAEIEDTTDFEPESQQFFDKCAERYTDIIYDSQVVDSVLTRSANMRSNSEVTKFETSFMSEPTKQLNQMERYLYDLRVAHGNQKQKAMKKLGRAASAFLLSAVVNSMAASIMDAVRDDDRDLNWFEKWLRAFTGVDRAASGFKAKAKSVLDSNLAGALNPLTYFPWLKSVWSIIQGVSVDRMDLDSFGDFVQASKRLFKSFGEKGTYTIGYAVSQLIATGAKFLGLPVANVEREILAFGNTFANETSCYPMLYVMDRMINKVPTSKTPNKGVTEILYNAYLADNGSYEVVRRMMDRDGYDTESIDKALDSKWLTDIGWKAATEAEDKAGNNDGKVGVDEEWSAVPKLKLRDPKEKEYLIASIGTGDAAWKQYTAARDSGVSQDKILAARARLRDFDKDGNGNYKQEEIKAALDAQSGLTNKERAVLWQAFSSTTSAKNNPYDTAVGEAVLERKGTAPVKPRLWPLVLRAPKK